MQECGAGLVELRRAERLAFAAPPLIRSGPVTGSDLRPDLPARSAIDAAATSSTPPGSTTARAGSGVLLADAEAVLALEPDWSAFGDLDVGVVGAYREARAAEVGAAVEVRAFCPGSASSRTR